MAGKFRPTLSGEDANPKVMQRTIISLLVSFVFVPFASCFQIPIQIPRLVCQKRIPGVIQEGANERKKEVVISVAM